LGEHIGRFARRIFCHNSQGLLQGFEHKGLRRGFLASFDAFLEHLGNCPFFFGFAVQQGKQLLCHGLWFERRLSIGAVYKIECMRWTGVDAESASIKALGKINLPVLSVGRFGGADKKTYTVLCAQAQISGCMHDPPP
jgi:hypothetical protein